MEVLNPKGISGLHTTSYIYLYGHMDLHGNPISDFEIYMRDGATFANGSDYGKVIIDDIEVTLHSNVPADVKIMPDGKLKVASGDAYIINGDVLYEYGNSVTIIEVAKDAVLTINGDIFGTSGGAFANNGTLICNGNSSGASIANSGEASFNGSFTGVISQSAESANIYFRGDTEVTYRSSVTGGTFIFDGTETQKVHISQAYNVEVLNPNGIRYLSNVNVYGNFDVHKNPIYMGSYKTNFYDGGGFGTLSENQSDWIIGVQPTYTTAGERYKECLVCGEKICTEEIPVLTEPLPGECEHCFSEWSILNFPTCTNSGIDTRKCVLCDLKEERTTDALGHDQIQHPAQSATCTEPGWNAYETCTRCDYTTYVEIPAKGHEFGEWIQTVAPGCETKGEERRECANCDHYETREIEALGYLQAFVDAVDALSRDQSAETKYNELYSALQLYAKLTDAEKAEASEEFLVLQTAINAYNSKAETANTELKNATEIAFAPISASFAFLAALWFLLKKKFWIK